MSDNNETFIASCTSLKEAEELRRLIGTTINRPWTTVTHDGDYYDVAVATHKQGFLSPEDVTKCLCVAMEYQLSLLEIEAKRLNIGHNDDDVAMFEGW